MLRLYGVEPKSVFSLLGTDENSATFALGWLLKASPTFFSGFTKSVTGTVSVPTDRQIELQRFGADAGYTDIEIICPTICHIIVEAKRGWYLPSKNQLLRYIGRLKQPQNSARAIVSLSAATTEYASGRLPTEIDGVPVSHFSWLDIKRMVLRAHRTARSFEEKLWLRQMGKHLEDYISMQNPRDNNVFLVSLSRQPVLKDTQYTWIDVVEKDNRYFHPVGNRWPVFPPSYIGFRYGGQLRTVHHIDQYSVVRDLSSVNRKWPKTNQDHFIYELGPAMKPMKEIRNGSIYPNGRYWCAIDTLLSGAFKTISKARDETRRRLGDE